MHGIFTHIWLISMVNFRIYIPYILANLCLAIPFTFGQWLFLVPLKGGIGSI